MKKLLLFCVVIASVPKVNAEKCGCDPHLSDDWSLTGNYTYDRVRNLYLIEYGDTLSLSCGYAVCYGSTQALCVYRNDTINRGGWKIYRPGRYLATSSCDYRYIVYSYSDYPWGFGFTVAFKNTEPVSSNPPVNFIYSASEKTLQIRTFDLNEIPSRLTIYDVLGRELYSRVIQFKSGEDYLSVDLGNNFLGKGLYVTLLQYGEQKFTYKLVYY